MNILAASDAPMMLKVIFWILLLLLAIGGIGYAESTNPNLVRGRNLVVIVLMAILGYYTFGF